MYSCQQYKKHKWFSDLRKFGSVKLTGKRFEITYISYTQYHALLSGYAFYVQEVNVGYLSDRKKLFYEKCL